MCIRDSFHIQSDRLDGFPLQLAHLARHVLVKILPWFLTRKAIRKLGVKPPELLYEPSDVLFIDQQFRDGKTAIINTILRDHGPPPVLVYDKQVTESGYFVNIYFCYVSL